MDWGIFPVSTKAWRWNALETGRLCGEPHYTDLRVGQLCVVWLHMGHDFGTFVACCFILWLSADVYFDVVSRQPEVARNN